MERTHQYAEFSPAEVARITGLSQDQQRDWRRRGVLVMSVEGRAVFRSTNVAEVLVRKELQACGVPLTEAQGAVALATLTVVDFAAMWDGGDYEPLSPIFHTGVQVRYLLIPLPLIDVSTLRRGNGDDLSESLKSILPAIMIGSLSEVDDYMERLAPGASSYCIIDMKRIGEGFARKANRPLFFDVSDD